MLRKNREIEIAELAESVAEYFSDDQVIDLETIAGANAISFDYGSYESCFDGMLQCQSGKFHIFLNLEKIGKFNSPRARFTLAHELGHYYIDEHRNALLSGRVRPHTSMVEIYNNNNLAEREADCFASNLLMPSKRFLHAYKSSKRIGMAAVLNLANAFQVSVMSAAINFIKRDVNVCALVKWGPEGYEWSLQSKSLMSLLSKKLYFDFSPRRDTATYKAMHQSEAYSLEFYQSVSTLSTWCKGIFPTSKENYILNEESLKLGKYGGITLLTLNSI